MGGGLALADRYLVGPQLYSTSDTSRIYDYVVSTTKFEAVDWMVANMSPTGRLAIGSSEFGIQKSLVPQCPPVVFGENNCGVDLTEIGEAYDQCIWQAIAAGAYANRMPNRECIVFISPQWFFRNPDKGNKLSNKFSYELYRAFCRNESIPESVRSYVRARAQKLGVDSSLLSAASRDTVLDAINDLGEHKVQVAKLRSKIPAMVAGSPTKSDVRASGVYTGEPDWEGLLTAADTDAPKFCTTNDLGVYDDYWNKNHMYTPEQNQVFDEADTEYADFSCTLDVLNACGMSTLVIMQPMHGPWYDHMNITQDVRDVWYDTITDICDDHDVAYADFRSCEYERYFFCDTVHPGWRGWPRMEEAIYHFVQGVDDDFVGGAGFGKVTGQGLQTMKNVQVD